MSNNAKKRKKFIIKKIINRLEKIVDWLTGKRYFLLITIPIISLLLILSCFFRIPGFLLAVLLLILYMFIVKKRKSISFAETVLALFLIILVGLGPNYLKNEIKEWVQIIKEKFVKCDVTLACKLFVISLKNPPGEPIELSQDKIAIKEEKHRRLTNEEITRMTTLIIEQKLKGNIINNGNFEISPTNKLSKWGHGLYSDEIKRLYPEINLGWINFLNANIAASIEETKIGNALKIVHKSKRQDDKVGIIEQYIKVTPGVYKLTFWIKAEKLEANALQFTTKNDWSADPANGGCEFDRSGTFDWYYFEKPITIEEAGIRTFTIASKAPGICYITDISLIKEKRLSV
ncbi:MAG: hypothetical protein HQ536_01760 [Parcubacteria group bacterium]|nr:hypothetical protein [Parcubacteria group bacterium]